ncbi:hypothetical protein Syun_014204 [Stephania yunnanensis]|uniref:Uncharacterized protein n=1 Tax=Stephania yunnanensis TaxID=152371 RepID=A0AAP0P9B5_9MAGN
MDKEMFWLTRVSKQVTDVGNRAQRETMRREGTSVMVDLLNNDGNGFENMETGKSTWPVYNHPER